MPFDYEELEKLMNMGAVRVRYPDGSEVEFSTGAVNDAVNATVNAARAAAAKAAQANETTPTAVAMPTRAELQAEVVKLTPLDGAPTVTP